MPTYDRDELLAHTDLAALFEALVGPAHGHGRSAMWPCPAPDHGAQTGKTPPVSIDAENRLWRCHACGAAGTAVDLLVHQGYSVGEAMAQLAERAGIRPEPDAGTRQERRSERPRSPATTAPHREPVPSAGAALDGYVAACEAALWTPAGEQVLAWLRSRGLDDDVLRANRVGADAGDELTRPGMRSAIGAVFPVLDPAGRAIYLQRRNLHEERRKFDNPTGAAAKNPRLAVLAMLPDAEPTGSVVVCEGMPDALTIAATGNHAVAILGASYPNDEVARHLLERFPDEHLVLAFDGDHAGQAGGESLARLLVAGGARGRVWRLPIPETIDDDAKQRDVNRWRQVAGNAFDDELRGAWDELTPIGWEPVHSAADLLARFVDEQSDRDRAVCIPTGISQLDELLARGGWRPGVVLLGGLAGIGKTALAMFAALHAAGRGHPVLYVSVEQSPLELLGRIFCRETQRPIADYWNRDPGYLSAAQEVAGRLGLEHLYLRGDPFEVHDELGTVGRVRRWAADVLDATGQAPLVIVDYLQRMRPPEAERRLDDHRQISLAGLGLRQMARDVGCPVVAISSVNRQSYDKAPSLDAFKGSGDLEYDADACLLLRFKAASDDDAKALANYHGVVPVELFAVKNRYGPMNVDAPIQLDFDRGYGGFRERPRLLAAAGADDFDTEPPPPPPPQLLPTS